MTCIVFAISPFVHTRRETHTFSTLLALLFLFRAVSYRGEGPVTHITQTWLLKPVCASRQKHCSRCNLKTEYISSGKFRCNSNGKSIDVWLIYNCSRCQKSWNMPVEERRRVSTIPSSRLQKYYANDTALANEISGANSSSEYTISKRIHCDCNPACIQIVLNGNLKLRADRLLAGELGLSRKVFRI